MMSEWIGSWLPALETYLTVEKTLALVRAGLLLLGGMLVARLGGGLVRRLTADRFEPQQSMLFRRIASYGLMALFVVMALHQLGFNLSVLLGAAGIFSVALGFASQTSASNLVSGLFLIGEKPFGVGDVIQVGSTTGEVLSIDLMSVKLRTFDNLFVRIPNESLIKAEVRTLTRFPIRRCDLVIGVAYKEDVESVRQLLFELADRNPLCLDEPKPVFIVQGFGDSAVNLQFSPWALRENFLELKNTIQKEIKEAFDAHGIEIPFPHRTFYTGAETSPFPVQIVGSEPGDSPPPAESEAQGPAT